MVSDTYVLYCYIYICVFANSEFMYVLCVVLNMEKHPVQSLEGAPSKTLTAIQPLVEQVVTGANAGVFIWVIVVITEPDAVCF